MTPLEKLGLEVAAFNLLGDRGKAALLCALIHAFGRVLSCETLVKARAYRMNDFPDVDPKVVRTRMCWLRECLEDVGLGGVIVTHKGVGYALPEPDRTRVVQRLIEAAA